MSHDSPFAAIEALKKRTEDLLARSREPGALHEELAEHIRLLRLHQARIEIENEELRQARRRMENSHAKYADFYDNAPAGCLILDDQGVILGLNAFAASLLEGQTEPLVGRPLSLSIHPGFQELFHLHLANVLQSAAVESCELLLNRKDGTVFSTQLESAAAQKDGQTVIRSVLIDVTARRRSERETREDLDLLHALIQGTSDVIQVKDGQGRYILFNAAAERLTGLKAADVIGRDDASVFPPDEAGRIMEADRALAEAGNTETCEETVTTAEGEKTYLSSRGVIRDGEGRVKGLFRIARDISGLKKTQKALVNSEARLGAALRDTEKLNRDLRHRIEELDAVFNTAPIGIAISQDPQCLHIKGNPALAAMLRLHPGDNLSRTAPPGQRPLSFREMQDGRELPPREAPMQVAAAKGVRTDQAEIDLVHDDGRVAKLLVSAAPLRNEHGSPRGAVGAFLDISELKKTQEKLSGANRRLTAVLESITDAFVAFDRRWRCTYVNDTACRLFMRSREELLGQDVLDAFPEALRERFRTDLVRAVHEKTFLLFEEFFPVLNAWYECHCYPSSDGLSVYLHDITERKRAEEARKQYCAKLDALVDVSRDVLAAASFDEMLQRAADGAKALTGMRPAAVGPDQGERPFPAPMPRAKEPEKRLQGMLFTLEESPGLHVFRKGPDQPGTVGGEGRSSWQTVVQDRRNVLELFGIDRTGAGHGLAVEPDIRREDNGALEDEDETVLSRLAAFASLGLHHIEARNEVERLVEERTSELRKTYESLKLEMEQRKKAEQQLRKSQKMEALGTMAGGIGHDFNNVLAAVIGFTQLAYDRLPAESAERHRLERVLEAGLRGRELVNQMLTFSSQAEQQKKPLLVSDVVKEAMKLLRPSIPTTVDIKVSLRREPGLVMGDAAQIRQVIVNLCNNASDAMKQRGGTLEIELGDHRAAGAGAGPVAMKPGSYVRLTVRDTGAGIPPENMDKLFDPFFTTKNEEGAGLGLSVVHGIVEQTGGYITVSSEPGRGTVFDVYLPVTEEASREARPEGETIPTGHERVLFVDDERALCEMGQEMLGRLGYQVTTETSSIAALKLFIADPGRFDIVLTDQTMPNLTGLELARQIICLRPDIPVVLITGFSYLVDSSTAKAAGVKAFMLKPLTKEEIAKTVRETLDKAL